MKSFLTLKNALILSLLFNVFFVLGFAFSILFFPEPSPDIIVSMFSRKLGLSEHQTELFRNVVNVRHEIFHKEERSIQETERTILDPENVPPETIDKIVTKIFQESLEEKKELLKATLIFRRSLRPEQKKELERILP